MGGKCFTLWFGVPLNHLNSLRKCTDPRGEACCRIRIGSVIDEALLQGEEGESEQG
jgi:hypothetical protein